MVKGRKRGEVHIKIDRVACRGCEICVEFCEPGVLGIDDFGKAQAVKAERCTACRLCELRCPDRGIFIVEGKV